MNDDIRPDLPDDALRSSLRHAADDVAFAVPDLLPRARAARRRRRVVGTTKMIFRQSDFIFRLRGAVMIGIAF